MTGLDDAREALRARQGQGARYDAPEAPAGDLAQARLGTAFFARKLNELSDAALYEPSLVPGRTRAHLICEVAYQARAICRQVEAITGGDPVPAMYDDRHEAIELGATLPPRALRHLFDHAAVHLNVVWRDLPGPGWDAAAPDDAGTLRPLRATAGERARLLWQSAFHLGNGARLRDLPADFRPDTYQEETRS